VELVQKAADVLGGEVSGGGVLGKEVGWLETCLITFPSED
jgi:hypothetical protein